MSRKYAKGPAEAFAHGCTNTSQSKNIFIDGDKIYSYGYHFVIAQRISSDVFIITTDRYSPTTAGHRSAVRFALVVKGATIFYAPGAKIEHIAEYTYEAANTIIDKLVLARKSGSWYTKELLELRDLWNKARKILNIKQTTELRQLFNFKLKCNENLLVKMVELEMTE